MKRMPGIPFRPVRCLGSEFLGKRLGGGADTKPTLIGSKFLGKRGANLFLPERSPHDLFSKRGAIGSEFLSKRDNGIGAANYADVSRLIKF